MLQKVTDKPKLILMPRGAYKSSIATIGYSLWQLTLNDSMRILIYSDTTEKAQGFLEAVKNHIMGTAPNSSFRKKYGKWEVDQKQGVWNQSAIEIAPRSSRSIEPSIDTAGIETSKVGKHYDLIIFDDIVTDKNITTPDQMNKVAECYRKSLSLLMPGGKVIMVGTRWHFGDIYGKILAENEKTNRWMTLKAKASENEKGQPYPFSPIGLTRDFLDLQRAEQGTYLFSCLYEQEPTDPATAAFKAENFSFYDPLEARKPSFLQSLYITCCIDPAISQAKEADHTAITVVGTDKDWNMYLLDAEAGRFLPDETLDIALQLHNKWNFRVLGIETTSFQRMLARDLSRRIWEERKTNANFSMPHIEQFKGISQRSKEQRILGLQPYHENGRIKFPGERLEFLDGVWKVLAFQMLQFPHSSKDDLMDSLAYHVYINRVGTPTVPQQTIPYSSAAWFEREQQKKTIQINRHLPRWKRQTVPQLVFS